ncbi:hypothetical protein HY485_02930 [Candidatus Woesearchaeota archaeon]|nr:hypothetical protein [Candidatus Woesearchaeota archaeon]
MRENYLHSIASLLIFLILTIPFYTTSVYAAINRISVKGSAGIEGYARKTDFLTFNVHALISNDTITNNQVILGTEIRFDACSGAFDNGSVCTLRFPSNGTEQFESKVLPFTIKLFRDNGTLDDSKVSEVVIDTKAPVLKISLPQQRFSSKQNVVVNYEATDFACDDASCSNKCAGLKSIDFNSSSGFKQTIAFNTSNISGCTANSSITIESKRFNEGENTVFAKATDKFDQASQEISASFAVDTKGPTILTNSFAIIRKGFSLSTYGPNPVPVDVFVNISADDLNPNSVVADLSVLNPSQKNVMASCTEVKENLHACKWTIDLNPASSQSITGSVVSDQTNASKPKSIIINTSDTSGNVESVSITKSLLLDDKGPVVLLLSTQFEFDGKAFARGIGNTITAVFDETTGLIAGDVFLHAGSVLAATKCSRTAPWTCEWKNVNFGSVKKAKISIESDTKDILDNAISESRTVDVIVDNEAPVLRSINITAVGGAEAALPGIFKIGDKIFVVAKVVEENQLTAKADFSKFVKDASNVAGSCSKNQTNDYVCTWITDEISMQATAAVTFNFSDNVGNSLIVARPLKTLGLEPSEAPDFWKNTVTCSPKTIDRSLGPLINQRLFCEVKLEPKKDAPSTLFISPAVCTDDSSILQSVETIHNEPGSTTPFLIIMLKKSDFKLNNAKLACSFNIKSRVGDLVTKNPEIETADINVPFYNLPLGEFSDEIKRKIIDAKEDAEGIWDIIGILNKLVFYAKKICQLINTLYTILAILYFVYIALKVTEVTCTATVFGDLLGACIGIYNVAKTGCEGGEKAQKSTDTIKQYSDKFCAYVNCKETILWGPAVKEWVNNLPGAQYIPKSEYGERYTRYMDAEHNLFVATAFACLPGIIYGLDKYRQIKCLYADCLFNAVGKEGLPVTACEDEKAYATCKYITGEIFALIPWTAMFDYFFKKIKESLSNPFAVIGVAVSLLCTQACKVPKDAGVTLQVCKGARLFALVGDAAQNVQNIIDEGFTIRTDYCSRLDNIKFEDAPITNTTNNMNS